MQKMRELIDILNYHTKLYNNNQEIMSDEEWDKMYFQLQEMEKETGIIYPDSPTQTVSYEVKTQLNKIKHNHEMLSLDKTKELNEIDQFIKNKPVIAMFKMDGLTCSLTYADGRLVRAETRGNGIIGEDILHNAKVIKNIPQTITYKEHLVVDGEIVCTKENFIPFQNEYKNPRNFAAGSVRLLDSKKCEQRNLSFIAWEVIEGFSEINSLTFKLKELIENGFSVVPFVANNMGNIHECFDILYAKKDLLDLYPIDGFVFKFDNILYGQKQGKTDHHFKNAIAYKFVDELYESKVKTIDWTMGRTGQLTPVLVYEDIDIEGTICNRASLHNITIMTQLMGGAYPGQTVFIYKSNQIIPQVKFAQNDNPNHIPLIEIPKKCPYCGHPTQIKKENNSEILYCTNENCNSKLINKIDYFCGKKGLDIKGLSKATLNKLIEWGWVQKIEDIYHLEQYKKEWINKKGFGQVSVEKILKSIENSKQCFLWQFIASIGIPKIGVTAAKKIELKFKTWESFRNAIKTNYNFWELPTFGEEMDSYIKNFNYQEADRIRQNLSFLQESIETSTEEKNLTNFIIVITGTLQRVKNRAELKSLIELRGGKVTGSVSKKTTLLINNNKDSNSTKNKTAKLYNIPILTEEEFFEKYLTK